jgi:glutathione S-transferase
MAKYRLHYFPESGNSYKLALMLSLCGQDFDLEWTDFAGGITRTPEWRARVNPMGEIPVLEEEGIRLTQTAPILLLLADTFGRLHPITEAERFEVLRWMFWDNHKMSSNMATYRFRRAFTESPDPHIQAYIRGRVDDALAILEQRVKDRPFIIGDRATVADVSICGYLSFPPDESGYDLAATHPAIHAWLQRIAALPGWKPPYELMPGKRLPRYG